MQILRYANLEICKGTFRETFGETFREKYFFLIKEQKYCDNSCRASKVEIKQEINEYVDFLKNNDVDENDATAVVKNFEDPNESEDIDINDASNNPINHIIPFKS